MSGEYPKTEEYIKFLNAKEGNLRGVVYAKSHFLPLEFLKLEEKRKDFIRSILGWVSKKAEINELEKK